MEITTIGLEIAKNVFQVHGVDGSGRAVLRRKVKRDQLLALLGGLIDCTISLAPEAGWLVTMHMLIGAAAGVLVGRIGDIRGRKATILLSAMH